MADKTSSTQVTQQKKVFVKSEAVLKKMEEQGLLEPFTEYYTPDGEDIDVNRPCVNLQFISSADTSVTGTSSQEATLTLATETKILPAGTYLCYVGGVIKTSTLTTELMLYIDGNKIVNGKTNLTTPIGVTSTILTTLSSGTHTISLTINSRAKGTVPAYHICSAFIIRVGD